ncbi:PE family protein [Mycobacterium tuberculosis]|nr:PE family protein [Mycobacterium tuberculosis]
MSFVLIAPEFVTAAAGDLTNLGSSISAANASAASATTQVLAAGADEVSARIAALFGGFGLEYQAISAQVAAYHQRFVQALSTGAGAYASAEAAAAEQIVLGVINAPTQALLGRPLIGDGANATTPGGAGGAGGLLFGNGGAGRPGPAGPAVAVQQPAGPAGLPGPRCAVGAVADQRTPQQQLGGRVHNVEQALQRRRGGGLSARVRASARSKGLNELGMKRRHLSAHRLIGLAMRGEQRRDGRRHLISTGCQKFRRRAQCRGVGGPQRRPDVRQIRSGPHQRLGSGDYKRHAFLRSAVRRVSSSS